MLRRRSTATIRYYSTSRIMRTHKRGSTCEQEEALNETDQLLLLLRRASATTALVRDRCPSSNERSYKLATLAVEVFGCLGKEGSDLIGQVEASIVGGTDGSSLMQKYVCEKRLL